MTNEPQNTFWGDMGGVFSMFAYGIRHPGEGYLGYMPTLNELTFGMLGKSFKPERDIGDLSGKVVLVTGSNAGIGKETIFQLALHQPKRIYLAARSKEKADKAIESLREALPNPVDIKYLSLDLTTFASITSEARTFILENDRLDILILNAGVLGLQPGITEAGHEIQFGTNHVGHFLFTKLLLPTLIKTASEPNSDVRVVTLSSFASGGAPKFETWLSAEKLNGSNTFARYSASKAANILFAAELARRHPEIMSVAVHPGVISSGLYEATKQTYPIARYVNPWVMRSVRTGAYNQLWVATVSRDKLVNGTYYSPIGNAHKHNIYATNTEWAKKLWEWSEAETSNVEL